MSGGLEKARSEEIKRGKSHMTWSSKSEVGFGNMVGVGLK